MKNAILVAMLSCLVGGGAFAGNPVVVNSGATADGVTIFNTVQSAIDSWCVGGTNAGETAPFVINIAAGTTYDEGITLDSRAIYSAGVTPGGNIVGDIVIQSSVPNSPVTLKLQKGPDAEATSNDGLFIMTNADHDFTFNDIIFTRSLNGTQFTDEMVRVDEISANTNVNTYTFDRCVFAHSDASGNPLATDKASALLTPGTRGGTALIAGARLLQIWPDAGEQLNFVVRDCVFYATNTTNATLRLDGSAGTHQTGLIENCLSTYSGFDAFALGFSAAGNTNGTYTVTGTDQKAGPLNCTAGLWMNLDGHGISIVNGGNVNVDKFIAYGTSALSRGISGGAANLTVADTIINVPFYGIVDNLNNAATWNRVTIRNTNRAHFSSVAGGGSFTVRDGIFAGPGQKFGGVAPTGGATVQFSGLPTVGPDAITSIGAGVTATNNTSADLIFLSKTSPNLASFMDVDNNRPSGHPDGDGYGTAAQGGLPLSGGADFVGGTVPVSLSGFSID